MPDQFTLAAYKYYLLELRGDILKVVGLGEQPISRDIAIAPYPDKIRTHSGNIPD